MADFNKFWPFVVKEESPKYVDDPRDPGGPTKYGITLVVWQKYGYDINHDGKIDKEDVKLISEADASKISKKEFWDFFNADKITNQGVAEQIVDFAWASGPYTAATKIQKILGLPADGVFGNATLTAINSADPKVLLEKITKRRIDFIDAIVAQRPVFEAYKVGWKSRVNAILIREQHSA